MRSIVKDECVMKIDKISRLFDALSQANTVQNNSQASATVTEQRDSSAVRQPRDLSAQRDRRDARVAELKAEYQATGTIEFDSSKVAEKMIEDLGI